MGTGLIFWYWDHYRKASDRDIKQHPRGIYNQMDFGGHSLADLCVSPRFESLKEEALESGAVDIEEFNATVVDEAGRYLAGRKCKAMNSAFDAFEFGIAKNSPLSLRHVQAVLLYTDFSEFSTAFSSSFRKLSWNDSIRDANQRNACFFHTAKALRECVQLFGCENTGYGRNGTERGPFFTGMSVVLNIPSFAINLQGPTSTSKQNEVAMRFAGHDGLIIKLSNEEDPEKY